MRIGMFCNAYKPVMNGVVRSIMLYRQGLQQAGHFVPIFAPDSKGYVDDEPFVFRYPALPLPTGVEYTFPVVMAPQITWLVPKLKLEIIHTHHPFIVGSEALNFSRSEGIPLVFTFHTMYHEYTQYFGFDVELFKLIVKRIVADYAQKADCIIAPSQRLREELHNTYRVDRPVQVLPYPVDLGLYGARPRPLFSDDERIRLLYMGRITREKNLPFLVRSFAHAAAADERLHLRIVGEGPELPNVQAEIASLDLSSRIVLTGAAPFSQTPAELLQADLFVSCAKTETPSMVVLEAMAAGLPLVLVDYPALYECVTHEQEALLTQEDEVTFAQAILSLVHNPAFARTLGRSGRIRARNYSVSVLTNRLLAIYQDTLDRYYRKQAS